ncbi:MAG: GerW family sporulation protein [Clostridiales bacterium]|nr:GerW family sporulation protein [Clostridiales bacterium]MDY3833125.1 GerW family sporulation protein [Candidatus Ventricola sp.]MCI6589182.1 GerW family sporulation protein [Clostridiales bacterium]MCI7703628.1 GerW family sporulation protein [Clostridiales bacterium]MDY4543174.1 GerW family sporulation protein [Candidatus Ventricola sp.]
MEKHPIESLMGTSMESIREMVDVNTVVGDPVQTQDGSTIIPISKVSFGFVAGGGEYLCGTMRPQTEEMPFAGGAGAGVSVHPMGFLVCSQNGVRLLSANCTSPMERIVEMIPQALEGLKAMGEEEDTQRKPSQQVRAAYQE